MKKLFFMTAVVLWSLSANAQTVDEKYGTDPIWSNKYSASRYQTPNVYDYLDIAKRFGWQPTKDGTFKGDYSTFEKVMLSMKDNQRLIDQLNVDSRYYCAKNHEYLFERYNSKYLPVSHVLWDEFCPFLYTLMRLDEVQ